MVVLGGVTRLTRSGLSMTDWKFTGEKPPRTQVPRSSNQSSCFLFVAAHVLPAAARPQGWSSLVSECHKWRNSVFV